MARCLPCIACGRELTQVMKEAVSNQPWVGTAFKSYGHYGSTAFDPMNGHFIEINVCDLCLITHTERVNTGRDRKPVTEEGVVVGWEDCDWNEVPWNPEAHTFDHVLGTARKEFQLVFEDQPDEE